MSRLALTSRKLTRPQTVNEALLDRSIRHSIHMERLKAGEVRKIVRLLDDDVLPDIQARLDRALQRSLTPYRMRQALQTTREMVNAGFIRINAEHRESLVNLAKAEGRFQKSLIRDVLQPFLEVDVQSPSAQTLRSMVTSRPFEGETLNRWWRSVGARTQVNLERQLRIGWAQGDTIPQLTSRFRGVYGGTRRDASAIVRTATTHVSAQARELTYEENDDLIEEVLFVATLDSRTTLLCASYDGKTFKIGEGPRPPLHFACRSTTVPVIKGAEELGLPPAMRASVDGQVPASTTYPEWLKNQSAEVQAEALGPTRAKLFRDGKVTIDRFLGVDDRPLTLEALARREKLRKKDIS